VPLPWILAVLLRDRRAILTFLSVGAAVSLLVALLQPRLYTASFSFLPQATSGQGTEGLAGLAGQLGFTLGAQGGTSQPPQLFADFLDTREVLAPVASDSVEAPGFGAKRVSLADFLGFSDPNGPVVLERTIQFLRRNVISTSVAARTTGVVSVRVRTASPTVSLAIAVRLLDGLNRINRQIRQVQASEERRFIEGRLEAARASLRAAEDALQKFLQANRQFGGSSQLSFQRDRIEREVALRQEVVIGLAQQSEGAGIREVRDTPAITIIEAPALPVLPDSRGRLRILAVGTMLAGLLGIMIVLVGEGWERGRLENGGDQSYAMLASEWRRFRAMIAKPFSRVVTRGT
jgi:uncharacterized protein involved in exopolysaccharide biosynthesis